jgi:SynChlorMet cassette protein ScmD
VKNGDKAIINPFVVLREEFDDWAIIFDPDTGHGFGLSPVGVHLWKLLDGVNSTDDLLHNIRCCAEDVPEEAIDHVRAFIDELAAEGLVGFGGTGSRLPVIAKRPENCSSSPSGDLREVERFKYEPPRLINLKGQREAVHGDCISGSGDSWDCAQGADAQHNCSGGCGPHNGTGPCRIGGCASYCCSGGSPIVATCQSGGGHAFCCYAGSGGGT